MIARSGRVTCIPIAVNRVTSAVIADDKYRVPHLVEQKVDITQSDVE
jgi:hypothetical protein